MFGGRWIIAAFAAAACGSDPPPVASDGDSDAGSIAIAPPAEPMPPAPPVLTPCPPGWIEDVRDGEPTTCLPWASDAPACARGEARFPGEASCHRIGTECPADGFPVDAPAGARFVDDGAAAGGDGTRARPFSTIFAALDGAPRDAVIAIATGTYDELIELPNGASLIGACASDTVLTNTVPVEPYGVTVAAFGTSARVENVTIRGVGVGIFTTDGGRIDVAHLIVEDTIAFALGVGNGGAIEGHDVLLEGTRPTSAGAFGRGIEVETGGRVRLDRVVVRDNTEIGVFAENPDSEVVLTDAQVCTTNERPGGTGGGRGVNVQTGARAEIRRASITENHEASLAAVGGGTVVVLEDVRAGRNLPDVRRARGDGFIVESSARLEATRVVVEHVRLAGIYATTGGATLVLRDAVIRDVAPELGTQQMGVGINVELGATATIERADVRRVRAAGVTAIGASVEARDLAIRDVAGDEGVRPGRGFDVERGGTATIERVLVARVHDDGIFADGEGTTLNAIDVAIEDVDSDEATGLRGHGLSIQERAQATVSRLRVVRGRNAGVTAHESSTLVLSDATVRATLGQRLDSALGRGIALQTGARAELARIDIDAASGLGLAAFDATTNVTAFDVRVHGTTQAECAATSCPAEGAGIGAGAYVGAELVIDRFEISTSALAGAQVARDACLTFANGIVRANPIGVNVRIDGYDLTKVTGTTLYVDNRRNVDAEALPIPTPPDLGRALP